MKKAKPTNRGLALCFAFLGTLALTGAALASPPIEAAPEPAPALESPPARSEVVLPPPLYTDDEVAAARHCLSEASGVRTDDCRVITWISLHAARREGVSVASFIGSTYHRHTRGSGPRPWLAGMNGRLTMPAGWPNDQIPWDTRGRAAWVEVLEFVRRVLRGQEGHGCVNATPVTWGGTMDDDGVAEWVRRGYRVLSCGHTANRIIGR